VHELSAASTQKQNQILDLARQSAEQGIGDNDLKRLQRQFDSTKATLFNIEQKKRFMEGQDSACWQVTSTIPSFTTEICDYRRH